MSKKLFVHVGSVVHGDKDKNRLLVPCSARVCNHKLSGEMVMLASRGVLFTANILVQGIISYPQPWPLQSWVAAFGDVLF